MDQLKRAQIYCLRLEKELSPEEGASAKSRWILSEPDCQNRPGSARREDSLSQIPDKQPLLNGMRLDIVISPADAEEGRIFPVFAQHAGNYAAYNQYLKMHGCACCSLTTILAAYCDHGKMLTPDRTIAEVEKSCFKGGAFKKNYSRHIRRQMPVSLFGISRILDQYGVSNRYIGAFRDREAVKQIKDHLYKGCPVIIETSRIRRNGGFIVSINDRKYAGSYHTMVLLGFNRAGQVLFTDSADRAWAGRSQRLKKTSLADLIRYMFPQKNIKDDHVYFSRRRNTGGYILVDRKYFT